jgi:FKBP-type peptidyl-prolyl cis-trans isomerase FkpA
MLKTSVLLGFVLIAVAFVACKKDAPYDGAKQLEIDDAIIAKYLIDSSVVAARHASGLYYKIIEPGAGTAISESDTVYGNYTLKILKDSVLLIKSLDSTFSFMLPGYMDGWKTGVSLIRPGGEIRMIIPSPLAYAQRVISSPKIPANSILDITLEIVSVNKKPK